jgi:lysophospholipase L1-like esterase
LNELVQENQGEIDLLFIGDSITQGWESAGSEVWNEFYGESRALNIGISADRTQHVLWRLENGNIDGIYPELTILMIGTNNSGADRNTPPEILAGVKAVVEKIRSSLPDTKILLLGIFPRGAEFNDQRGVITQVNQALSKMDGRDHIYFLDIGHAFLEPDGSISEEIMPDALHLSPAGYRIWAESIEPFISSHLDELKN